LIFLLTFFLAKLFAYTLSKLGRSDLLRVDELEVNLRKAPYSPKLVAYKEYHLGYKLRKGAQNHFLQVEKKYVVVIK
jgi:hypothetical protein